MKHVVNYSEVAHLWANQLQDNARAPGNSNFYFERDTIYSYGRHFPIAKHIKHEEKEVILFTERTYSNTTAKHIRIVRSACSHKNVIYCFNPESSHEQNFNSWVTEIEHLAVKLPKARKPEMYLSAIEEVGRKVAKYADFFGLPIPETLQGALSITDKATYSNYSAKKEEFEKAESIRKEKELKKAIAVSLKKFRAFESNRLHSRNGFDYLRYNKKSERVETSQGVEIPKAIAVKFYGWMIETAKNGGCTGCNEKLMAYDVQEVTKYYFVIGCHKISIKEAQKCYAEMA